MWSGQWKHITKIWKYLTTSSEKNKKHDHALKTDREKKIKQINSHKMSNNKWMNKNKMCFHWSSVFYVKYKTNVIQFASIYYTFCFTLKCMYII